MKELLRGYGKPLVTAFFIAVGAWCLVLILLPQIAMLERALTAPKRQLDSSIALTLRNDAETCIAVLKSFREPETPPAASGGLAVPSPSTTAPGNGGIAIPSPSTTAPSGGIAIPSTSTTAPSGGIAVPSASGIAVPSATGGGGTSRPYILQCDRATTRQALVRPQGAPRVFLHELYEVPLLAVSDSDPIPQQEETAREISAMADGLYRRLLEIEATQSSLTLSNFRDLTRPVLIPLTEEQAAVENRQLFNQFFNVVGLRYVEDGETYARLGLIILARTLIFAVFATALALVVCYPIAYKVALASTPERAVWLFLGLVIPYAIVELMRVYAWTSIVDNQGLINGVLLQIGAIGEPIQFTRSAITVFVIIVYTYVLFMVFPIFNVMSTLDRNQIEAAKDLGASTFRVHWRVIIPHAKPGIAVGCIATFMLSAGAFSVPRIISRGLQSEWFAQTIYNKFFESENSNVGAAYSFAYTIVCFVLVALFMYAMRTRLKDFARVQ
ncbi:MAG: ABC transporter permease subunit [Pseudomonadota bacterium]